MKEFAIPVFWEMSAVVYVTAENLDEAIKLAEECEHLPDGNYVMDSFSVAGDMVADFNENVVDDE